MSKVVEFGNNNSKQLGALKELFKFNGRAIVSGMRSATDITSYILNLNEVLMAENEALQNRVASTGIDPTDAMISSSYSKAIKGLLDEWKSNSDRYMTGLKDTPDKKVTLKIAGECDKFTNTVGYAFIIESATMMDIKNVTIQHYDKGNLCSEVNMSNVNRKVVKAELKEANLYPTQYCSTSLNILRVAIELSDGTNLVFVGKGMIARTSADVNSSSLSVLKECWNDKNKIKSHVNFEVETNNLDDILNAEIN